MNQVVNRIKKERLFGVVEKKRSHWVKDLQDRDVVAAPFLVRDKVTAMARNGKPYLTLKLMDKTGEVEGRVWDRVDEFSARFEKNDFLQVRGKASIYLNKMQLVVQDLTRLDEAEVDLGDFLPVSEFAPERLQERLRRHVASLENRHLRNLMDAFLADAEFLKRYSSAPAAKSMHHVYLGGLLEHSLAIADLVDDVSARYPFLDRDLLLVGALLHDVGKTEELTYARSFDYSDEGKLIGHIVIGVEMVEERVRALPEFPRALAVHLKHLLLSHHGQYDFGSPKRPKTLEAIALNFLDDLDSKMNGIRSLIAKEEHVEGPWTGYHRLYDRYFFKGEIAPEEENLDSVPAKPSPETLSRRESEPEKSSPKRNNNAERGFGFSLGEQLKGKSLDLFSVNDEEK